jgi:predicted DNA-binding protein
MSRYNILLQPESPAPEKQPSDPTRRHTAEAKSIPADQSLDRSTSQSSERLTSRSTELSTTRVVARPKAFYITERLDRWLDQAVDRYQTVHGIRRVDRSTIINASLDDESLWSEEALDQLVDRVIRQLTNRLTG